MPTYYVEDYDGEKNDDAVEREPFNPVTDDGGVTAKVVGSETEPNPAQTSDVAVTKDVTSS